MIIGLTSLVSALGLKLSSLIITVLVVGAFIIGLRALPDVRSMTEADSLFDMAAPFFGSMFTVFPFTQTLMLILVLILVFIIAWEALKFLIRVLSMISSK